jgi:hypothetical protein
LQTCEGMLAGIGFGCALGEQLLCVYVHLPLGRGL